MTLTCGIKIMKVYPLFKPRLTYKDGSYVAYKHSFVTIDDMDGFRFNGVYLMI